MFTLAGNSQLQHTMGIVCFGWESAAPTYNGTCLFQLEFTAAANNGTGLCLVGNSSLGWGTTAASYSETCFFGWEFTVTSYNGA